MVSVNDADQLPAPSWNCTDTVFSPSPVDNVQSFVVANGSAVVKVVPSFEKRICVTPLASKAESVSVTAVLFVVAALSLMAIDPEGGVVSGPEVPLARTRPNRSIGLVSSGPTAPIAVPAPSAGSPALISGLPAAGR